VAAEQGVNIHADDDLVVGIGKGASVMQLVGRAEGVAGFGFGKVAQLLQRGVRQQQRVGVNVGIPGYRVGLSLGESFSLSRLSRQCQVGPILGEDQVDGAGNEDDHSGEQSATTFQHMPFLPTERQRHVKGVRGKDQEGGRRSWIE